MLIDRGSHWARIVAGFIKGKDGFKDGSVLSFALGNTHHRAPGWPQGFLPSELASPQRVRISWHSPKKQHQVEN